MVAQAKPDFDYVRRLVEERAAIVLEESKNYLLTARLTPLAEREGFRSIGDMVRDLRSRPPHSQLHKSVVEAMTTNETSFFRDIAPFDALREKVLPEVIEHNQAERSLNIWSAACSSGQEAYSIAMILAEHFPQLAGWDVSIHATDISSEMVERTKEGIFSQLEVNRGLPARMLVKYFSRKAARWQVKEPLRARLRVQEANLIEAWPYFPKFDVVFMRNVMIYFNVETKRQILAKVRRVLKPTGFLFLGGAETTLGVDSSFERVPIANASCYELADKGAK